MDFPLLGCVGYDRRHFPVKVEDHSNLRAREISGVFSFVAVDMRSHDRFFCKIPRDRSAVRSNVKFL